MQNTKVIQFLKCLSKTELREFGKFVSSPYHNNRKDVTRFFGILKKYYPDFNIEEDDKKKMFDKLYPGKKFDPDSLVVLNSYLFNAGKEFLTINSLKEEPFFQRYYLLKSLDRHYANNLFEKEYKAAEEFLASEKLDPDYFLHQSLLEELNINFNLRRNRQDKICHNTVHFGDLTIYSFIVKLSVLYHDMLADKSAFNYEFTGSATDKFIKNFRIEEFITDLNPEKRGHNLLVYYYYLFMCNYYPDVEEYYHRLKEHTFIDFHELNEAEKSGRFLYLINYCLFQIESGNLKFLRETFNIYTETLEKKLHQFFDSKDIGLMFFRNFVLVGLAAGEYDYTENFIYEYGKELTSDHKDELLRLCYAMLHFEKKEYDKALDHLSRMDHSYPAFRLGIKHLYIKIYYEINEYGSFFSLMDSYRHFLKNDKTIPERICELHTNFLNYSGRLAKIKSSGELEGLFVLKKEIKANMLLDFRHKLWLVKKTEELK